MPDLSLTVGTTIHRGWEDIRITRSIEKLAHSFQMTLTDRWADRSTPRQIKPGEACRVKIDGELVITGYIDIVQVIYDATSHSVTIAGRSKAGDLVDCSHPGINYNQRTLLQLIRDLSAPFGIDVTADVDVGAKFDKAGITEGETFFECFDRMASYRAVRVTSTPNGDLLITRSGKKRIGTALKLGANIKEASGKFDHSNRFNKYMVRGQTDGNDFRSGADSALIEGSATDTRIQRHRPTVIIAEHRIDIGQCTQFAEWHRNTRFGRSQIVKYTVPGWHHAEGLWNYNELVPVDDPFMGTNGDRIIQSVDFILDRDGTRTELAVTHPAAFDLISIPPQPEAGGGGFAL